MAEQSTAQVPLQDDFSSTAAASPATVVDGDKDVTSVDQQKRLQHESQIRAALNQQTIIQFRQYAMEQYPKESVKQEELIRQLQEQHFQQYMTQVYQQQIVHQHDQYQQLHSMKQTKVRASSAQQHHEGDEIILLDGSTVAQTSTTSVATAAARDNDDAALDGVGALTAAHLNLPQIIPASLWTRRDIHDFKQHIYKESRECCIKIGSLATATIRVPTHEEGSCIFWEFATDHYDIGFGVYFEWSLTPSDKITVHISESDDEEDEDEMLGDVESGGDPNAESQRADARRSKRGDSCEDEPATDELIPVYRRDSHEEIYCGNHQYPGRGVYLLKFDNSYSLWRSKWLYYRVYYTR